MMVNETLTERQFKDNSCLVAKNWTRLLRQGSADDLANIFLIAALDVINCRPEPQNSFPITLSVLTTAVLEHFHCVHEATPLKSWIASLLQVRPSILYAAKSAVPLLPSHFWRL